MTDDLIRAFPQNVLIIFQRTTECSTTYNVHTIVTLGNCNTCNKVGPPSNGPTGALSLVLCREVVRILKVVHMHVLAQGVCNNRWESQNFPPSCRLQVFQSTKEVKVHYFKAKMCPFYGGYEKTLCPPCHFCVLFLCLLATCTHYFHMFSLIVWMHKTTYMYYKTKPLLTSSVPARRTETLPNPLLACP